MRGHSGGNPARQRHQSFGHFYAAWLSGIILTLIGLVLPFNAALAQDAGEIVSVLGAAEVFRDGHWQELTTGATIAAGEAVRTGPGSRAAIQLINGIQVKLNANSRLEFKQIVPPTEGFLGAAAQVLRNLLRVLSGEVWVRSGGEPLEIETVYATATVRGTEFDLAVEPGDLARLTVLTGLIEFRNPQGAVLVAANEQATAKLGEAPRKIVLLNPLNAVQWSLYYPDGASVSEQPDPACSNDSQSPRCWTQTAQRQLLQGQVAVAQQTIDRALALDPNDVTAYSLRSTIALVQNRNAEALMDAQRAVAANPASSSAYLSLSLAQQAGFDLNSALASAHKAVELDPDNSRALIQESNLLFGMGQLDKAIKVAEQARRRAPDDAMVNTVWGFLLLAQNRIKEAREVFQVAITQDSTLGLPHLGLGLALFQRNHTKAAVDEIRKATLLEPQVSFYNSYLGKAFYEIKDDRRAEKYLELAKQLDPHDPTPWLYDAIRLQSINHPGEALDNIQHSIDLNENRTVYRSRLLLDEDLATREVNQARIYENLGFEQMAQVKATQSLSFDPTNYSAHRFLSDSYSGRPRYEIAQVSELLQAQLLQPININPIQPSLVATNLNILARTGVSKMAFNEYMSLFERDQTQLYASGAAGNNGTWEDEAVVSGLNGRFSYSLGQFHYQTDGFRPNNDIQHDLYDLFVQAEVTPELNLQAEYRRRETSQGDLRLNFDGIFSPRIGNNTTQETVRIGARYSPSPQTSVIASLIYTDVNGESDFFTDSSKTQITRKPQGNQAEAQWLYKEDYFNSIVGFSLYRNQYNYYYLGESYLEFPTDQTAVYGYTNIQFPLNIMGTFGLSYDAYHSQNFSLNQLNPKLGLRWNITDQLVLRAAAFEVVKRDLIVNQTIEPTQLAGFNQFFDDSNGTSSKNYGVGLDAHLIKNLFGGLELSRRDLEIPIGIGGLFEIEKDQEDSYSAYLYWLLDHNWSVTARYFYGEFEMQEGRYRRSAFPTKIKTAIAPLNIRYFNPSGFFAGVGATYVDQRVGFDPEATSTVSGSDDFFLFDTTVGYRLPKRWGVIALEVRNLTDQQFQFQDYSFQTANNSIDPLFLPERTWLARVILNF